MNKTAIRNFAIWARNKLIAEVSYHAGLVGVTKAGIAQALPQSTKDVEFYDIGTADPYSIKGEQIRQRKSLVEMIRAKERNSDYDTAYNSIIEEVAYTWFNRLIAVRFMEVNDYLPTHVRVLSSESGKQEPDIVTAPFDAELDFFEGEAEQIVQMKNENQLDEVFRILFIKQCHALSKILPRLFEGTNDYTELLLTLSFIDQEGVVYHLIQDIPEDDFNVENGGQVEIIGWLYQFYNVELKDETFALLKDNVKVSKERIPAATQLFTPDWIVRYMVENSLGRLWIEGHPNDTLKSGWKYYIDEAEQEASVKEELEKIHSEYAKLNLEDIKVIDPCMGSGHILVYAFDVLMQIYESAGYTQRDAAKSILEHNLFGLDIDDRAAQLAYFAVMMKARQYNRRILDGETNCNVYAIKESNNFDRDALVKLGDDIRIVAEKLLDAFVDAKEYGSIISVDVTLDELDALDKRLDDVDRMSDYGNLLDMMYASILRTEFDPIIRQTRNMIQKYDAVITNPPYMGAGNMGRKLTEYVKKNYPNTKADLSTVFMEKSLVMCKENGCMSMINIPVWMFLSSYEKLREELLKKYTIVNMLHFGRGIFGSDFGTTAFVIEKSVIKLFNGTYYRLFKQQGAVDSVEMKEEWFKEGVGKCRAIQEKYRKIPGNPIAYWVGDNFFNMFKNPALKNVAFAGIGMRTGNNDRFLRLWFEVCEQKFNPNCLTAEYAVEHSVKWVPYNKGGEFRKWYGNKDYVVNWENNGQEIKDNTRKVYPQLGDNLGWKISNEQHYFKKGITWTVVSSKYTSFRKYEEGAIISNSGQSVISEDDELLDYLEGLLNSEVVKEVLSMISPTIGFESGYINKIPVIVAYAHKERVISLVRDNVEISKSEWNSFETAWDFKKHPLI